MEYIAHREEDRVQLLLQHLLGTAGNVSTIRILHCRTPCRSA